MVEFDNENIDEIPIIEPQAAFDASQYEGARIKIATVKQIIVQSHYIDGEYKADETVDAPVIEIETESLGEWETAEGKKPITVRARFNLQEKTGEDGKKQVVISKHSKAALWKFMRKHGVIKPSDLIGKLVTITTEPSKDENDDRTWLRVVK